MMLTLPFIAVLSFIGPGVALSPTTSTTLYPPTSGLQIPAPAASSVELDADSLYFQQPVDAFPGTVFSGNQACSASTSLLGFLAIDRFVVPTEEQIHWAVRAYQTYSNGNDVPTSVTYFDLQTGVLVTGSSLLNWTTQASDFTYVTLHPTLVDLTKYHLVLGALTQQAQGLLGGSSNAGGHYSCASSNPQLASLVDYLEFVQAEVANATAINGGLKPTEIRLPSGCIAEQDANFLGNNLTTVISLAENSPKQPTMDTCCQKCRDQKGCNVWVFCPSYEGCGGNPAFPAFGCQLKNLANLSNDPLAFPAASARGPPTQFTSGRIA